MSPWVFRGVVLGGVILAGLLFGIAGRSADTGVDDPLITGDGVERTIPDTGAVVLRQAAVGVELADGWDAELTIDGVRIPRDQLLDAQRTSSQALFRAVFAPGSGKVIEEFDAGPICAVADAFKIVDSDQRRSITWCFTVT